MTFCTPVLIVLCLWGNVYGDKDNAYCTEQRDSITVEREGSVTIPCHFSYPKNMNPEKIQVYWRHAKGGKCGANEFIYNHTEKYTHQSYAGRISLVGNPERERTAAIQITKLQKTDGPMFCCRISLHYNEKEKQAWQNLYGTYIKFKDEFFVEQPDVVPAVIAEDISIPCAIHNESPDNVVEIIWRTGTRDLCYENAEFLRWNTQNITQKVGRWRVQKAEKSFLLHIEDVRDYDSGQYCCTVSARLRSDSRSSTHGTQVVIADPNRNYPRFTVTQSGIIVTNEGDSITINCSYTVPPDQSLLWTGVFWRVGSPTGAYAYHPSDLMVHPNYSGRTQLSGLADLQITGVRDTDTITAYYCFVMLKICTESANINSVIKYGSATQLNMNGKVNEMNDFTDITGRPIVIIAAYFGIKVILLLLFIALCTVYVRRK